MLKRTCKQCGKEFILTDQEIRFFKSKNLNLPKRCKDCRAANKQAKVETAPVAEIKKPATAPNGKSILRILLMIVLAVLVIIVSGIIRNEKIFDNPFESEQTYDIPVTNYSFRSDEHLADHFEKHGAEVGASTIDEYLAMANTVINNPNSLTKIETDDGNIDIIYYLEATREFVIVSDFDYIRTYCLIYGFQSDEHLSDHFEEYGAEVGASTEEEYLAMANAVINNTYALLKKELDDGNINTVYYLESTREFVIVSEDDYIRTYCLIYGFRSDELLSDHFEKHGAEVGASTEEEYLAMANAVINNPDSLSKIETDDGDNDTVYYLESTREFVVVSEDGYIRAYYLADKDYFERQ